MGGAAVTEEIVPGFKFSRASYLLSLLRPVVVKELELKVCYFTEVLHCCKFLSFDRNMVLKCIFVTPALIHHCVIPKTT